MANRFLSRLNQLKGVRPFICAEGYLFEMERRGWIQIGSYVPMVVLNQPDAVKQLHREFVRCGSDVIQAFTYYAHREKLKLIGKEDLVTNLNKNALKIAYEVQLEFKNNNTNSEDIPLVAGGICNSTIYESNNPSNDKIIKDQFREQCDLFAEYNVDYIIAETFEFLSEAILATEVIKEYNIPSCVTLSTVQSNGLSRDNILPWDACKILKNEYNADVVGLNCSRGPNTMLPILKKIKQDFGNDDVNIAALPVCYQTTKDNPTMQAFGNIDEKYLILDCHTCTRFDSAQFAKDCVDLGVNYIGTCCGGAPHHIRAMAEAVGKPTIASENSPDLAKHYIFGDKNQNQTLKVDNLSVRTEWGKKDTLF